MSPDGDIEMEAKDVDASDSANDESSEEINDSR
jgi:hypothetical protein